ncbi:kelch-like protein 26 [Mercenaria mercenaria]|uniref:kelch-like protein 26 n=1 Tax=Mercenaria mercenaria TaxID=6596 RepID=UPI00234E488D|nr:kelch-like protein 26 [Mercenaria mercenaria]XP_053401557.1 kelch-like protein 26 [Mercenaria mercenaria]
MVIHAAIQQSSADPQVTFEASDHGDVVLAGLTKLRDMEQLFDVVLIVEKDRLPAHRVVLASCSEYFRAMFTDGLLESRLDEICLNGVTSTGMRNLIDFAYSSKIDIDAGNVEDVLCAANHIQLMPVVEACVNFLKSHIMLSNCVDMLSIAELFTLHDLTQYVYKYISKNISSLGMTAEFYKLSDSQLENLLHLNYPVDCVESDVLSAVIGWLVNHYGYNVEIAFKYLSKISFSSMTLEEVQSIPNFTDLDKMLSEEKDGYRLQKLIRNIPSSSALVPGLINVRGYRESVIVCGGFRPGTGMNNNVENYDIATGKMQYLTHVPHVDQCNFGITVTKNKLFVIGGCYNDDHMEEFIHGYGFCYDPAKNKWEMVPPMLMERCRFYLGSVQNRLYAIGGDPSASTGTAEFAQCECYDIETKRWQPIAPLPGNRMEHAGTAVEDSLFVSGGLQDQEGPVFNTFFKYDTNTDMWMQLPAMPSARADHSMFSYSGKIYVIGGWYDDDLSHQRIMASTIDCFDFNKGRWETIADVPSPRLFATYTLKQGKVIIIGGWLNGDCQRKCNNVETFDLETLTWVEDTNRNQQKKCDTQEIWEHASCTMYVPTCAIIES